MIKLHRIEVSGAHELTLHFSDGSFGLWDAAPIIDRATMLTTPLGDPDYFGRAFIEAGALAWPNGLELAPWTLHRELDEAGQLRRKAA